MAKVKYIGDRSTVLFGKHIIQNETREVPDHLAKNLIGNPNFHVVFDEKKVEAPVVVEEVITDPSIENLEAALTPVAPAGDEKDADESQGAEQVETADANETVDSDEDADQTEDDEETEDAE